MRQRFLTLLALLLCASGLHAQDKVSATLYARAQDEAVQVAVEVRVRPSFHIYHGPTVELMGSEGAVGQPTEVELLGAGFEFSEIVIVSKPHAVVQDFGEALRPTIYEHEGTVLIHARATKTDASADPADISGLIKGQVCDDKGCLPFESDLTNGGAGREELYAGFMVPGLVIGADAGHDASNGAEGGVSDGSVTPISSGNSGGKDEGLLAFLLSAVFWGIFTLLMPCTYPMIPITISYFTKQAEKRQTSVLPLSLTYGLGIVLIFVLIGLTLGSLIIPFAQHPITNLVIGAVFVVFALSLFGMFTLQAPAFLMNVAGQASMKGGYLGVFLMGATLVVTSFTCTAPFVGALLGTGASSGDHGRIALGMAVFGATVAIPFALLSMLPAKVKSIPKSGEWMHTLKVTMGFVELAAALKFMSNADLVWGWNFFSIEMFLYLWVAIFLVTALYLFGLIRLADEHSGPISPGRMVAGLFFTLLTAYSFYGALGNKLDPLMTAIAPPYSNNLGGGGKAQAKVDRHTIIKDDFEAAVERAKQEGKRVLINFTGFT